MRSNSSNRRLEVRGALAGPFFPPSLFQSGPHRSAPLPTTSLASDHHVKQLLAINPGELSELRAEEELRLNER